MINNLTFERADNYTESLFEVCQFEYELFLIESKAFSTFGKINEVSIQESYTADIVMLQESIKETLTIWVSRFTEALQKALDKFVAMIEGAQDLAYLRSIQDSVNKLNQDPGFNVNNLRIYEDNVIQGFNIVDFKTVFENSAKKASLESQEKFLIENYPNFFSEGKTDIKAGLESAIVKIEEQVNINVERIQFYYKWCRETYKKDIDHMQGLMNVYNTSTKSIQNIISQLPEDYRDKNQTANNPNVTQPNNSNQQSGTTESYYFHEEEGGSAVNGSPVNNTGNPAQAGQKTENPNKMTFDDKVNYVGKASGTNQDTVNYIRNYLTCTTKILSTLFIIIKNRKADYLRVLKHLFPMNREQKQTAASTAQIQQTNNAGQVNVANMPTSNK